MDSVQYLVAALKLTAEVAFLIFSIYILIKKNKKAGVCLIIYAIPSLFEFLLLYGFLGKELLEKVFYAGERVNLYLQVFSIIEALAKLGLVFGIYLLVSNRKVKEREGNDS